MCRVDYSIARRLKRPHMENQPFPLLTEDRTLKVERVNLRAILFFKLELVLRIIFLFLGYTFPTINVVNTTDSIVTCFVSSLYSSIVALEVDVVVRFYVEAGWSTFLFYPDEEGWEKVSRLDLVIELVSKALIVLDDILVVRRLEKETIRLYEDEEACEHEEPDRAAAAHSRSKRALSFMIERGIRAELVARSRPEPYFLAF